MRNIIVKTWKWSVCLSTRRRDIRVNNNVLSTTEISDKNKRNEMTTFSINLFKIYIIIYMAASYFLSIALLCYLVRRPFNIIIQYYKSRRRAPVKDYRAQNV